MPTDPPPKKSFARIVFKIQINLSHHISQKLFKRFYSDIDHALFVSTKVLREQHRDDEATRIEKLTEALCDHMSQSITAAQDQLLKLSEQSLAIASSDIQLNQCAEFSTGLSLRILNIFTQFDQLLIQIEAIELHNCCTTDESSQLRRFWQKEFRRFLLALQTVRNRTQENQKNA